VNEISAELNLVRRNDPNSNPSHSPSPNLNLKLTLWKQKVTVLSDRKWFSFRWECVLTGCFLRRHVVSASFKASEHKNQSIWLHIAETKPSYRRTLLRRLDVLMREDLTAANLGRGLGSWPAFRLRFCSTDLCERTAKRASANRVARARCVRCTATEKGAIIRAERPPRPGL